MDWFLFYHQCKNFVVQVYRLGKGIWNAQIGFDEHGRIHAIDHVAHGG